MAEASTKLVLDKISQGHLECPICCCRFVDPKMLSCDHSFCLACLKELICKWRPKQDEITCPVCRHVTPIPEIGLKGLKSSFFLSSLVTEFKIQERLLEDESENASTSEGSDSGTVLRFTFSKCDENDHRFRRTPRTFRRSVHRVIPRRWREPQPAFDSNNPLCIPSRMLEVAEMPLDIEKTRHQFQSINDSTEHVRNRLRVMVIRACQEITDKEKEEVGKMRSKYQMLREEVTQLGRDRGYALAKTLNVNRKKMENAERYVTALKDLTEQESNQKRRELKHIRSLGLKKDVKFEDVQHDLSFLGVKCHDIVDNIKDVGEVIQQERWRLGKAFGWEGLGDGESKYSGLACYLTGDTAVVDTVKKKVLIFSSSGCYKTEVGGKEEGEGKLTDPWGVAVTNDDQLVVADESAVKLYDTELKYICKFAPGQVGLGTDEEIQESALTGIDADKKDRVVIADAGRRCVSVIDLQDGSLLTSFSHDMANFEIAISNKECLFFTEYDTKKVKCTTFEGRELFSFSPSFAGRVCSPIGVCCDAAGDIYLSVHCGSRGSGEIHHYDPCGVHIGCVARGLYNPLGITFAPSGDLVVADLHSIKVFQRT